MELLGEKQVLLFHRLLSSVTSELTRILDRLCFKAHSAVTCPHYLPTFLDLVVSVCLIHL